MFILKDDSFVKRDFIKRSAEIEANEQKPTSCEKMVCTPDKVPATSKSLGEGFLSHSKQARMLASPNICLAPKKKPAACAYKMKVKGAMKANV